MCLTAPTSRKNYQKRPNKEIEEDLETSNGKYINILRFCFSVNFLPSFSFCLSFFSLLPSFLLSFLPSLSFSYVFHHTAGLDPLSVQVADIMATLWTQFAATGTLPTLWFALHVFTFLLSLLLLIFSFLSFSFP